MINQILVVDDESAAVDEILEALGDEGYTCSRASTLDEMQTVLMANPEIRLVITDLRMRGGRGSNLMALAREAAGRDLEFIVMASSKLSAAGLDRQASGIFEFLDKPLDVRVLVSVVDRAFAELH